MEPSASADKTEILDSPATLIGKTIDGRYLIERNLTDDGADAGGIGVLYLASDQKLVGRSSVVKVLRSIARDNDEIRRKFEHEKEALIKLRHPNIVDIQSIGILPDGNPFVVMEYIPGISLRTKLETEGRLDLKLAADIIRAVSNALAAAHS